jgi:hypothetical protein
MMPDSTSTAIVVNVALTPAKGYQLEIDGSDAHPFITEADATENLHAVVDDCVRGALGFPSRVALAINIIETQ